MEEKLYTTELKKVLALLNDLVEDYPIKKITINYYMLAVLQSKQSTAYKMLNKFLSKDDIESLLVYFSELLKESSATTVKPRALNKVEKSIGFDPELSKCLIDANDEKTKLNDTGKIGSEHVLLSILGISKNDTWNHIGLKYDNLFNTINAIKQGEITKYEEHNESYVESLQGQKNKPRKTNMVESYCVNLNSLAKKGKIDQIVGREIEISRLIKVLGRRNKNNVIIVGASGCGKSSIVSGLANMIEEGKGMFLNDKQILSLDLTALISGTSYRGMLEERMNGVINEVKANKDFMLFIDDIDSVLGSNSNNASDIAGILSSAMTDGDIQLIATTSFKGYKSSIESNPSLKRRFQKIIIDPTTIEQTEKILFNSKKYYEQYHNVIYTDEAIRACVTLANKYITDRQLPDSAIDIMDECGSEKKVSTIDNSTELFELKKDLELNALMVKKSYSANDFTIGDEYNAICKELEGRIVDLEKSQKSKSKKDIKEITEIDVYNIVSEITGVPINRLTTSEKERYLNIENKLGESIIGQSEAIKKVAQSMKRSRMGLGRKNKPASVMMFVGESSVGKTLLAKKLAEEIFDSEDALVRFDMSEYSDQTAVNKLIGGGPSYVGFEQGGLLTEAIKSKPYCVLLLDEIEKAHKDVLNAFLQVFDESFISDNTGARIRFDNVIIIMTSNIGAKDASSLGRGTGFQTNVEDNKKNIIDKALKSHFPLEFLNRVENIIFFNSLSEQNLKEIIKLELNNFSKRLKEINYGLDYSGDVIDFIYNLSILDKLGGARKINRTIQNEIENRIVDLYLENDFENGYTFKIEIIENKIEIK